MGFFGKTAKKGDFSSIARADKLREKAVKAVDDNDDMEASELYFQAAEYYSNAGESYWEKHCESWGWSSRARAINEETVEDSILVGEYYDNSIQADNNSLSYLDPGDPSYPVTEGNMRFTEGDKYTSLANAEVERANAKSGKGKAEHLERAAEYRLSGAHTMKLAAELSRTSKNMSGYNNRLGIYYRDRSGYHYYKASAEREMENWSSALHEYVRSRELREKAVELHRKSYKIKSDRNIKNNLKQDKAWLKTLKKEISKIRREAEAERLNMMAAAETGKPRLDVKLRAMEGMVQNLVSTLSLSVVNSGDGGAKDISVRLESPFFEGEKIAALGSLPPGVTTHAGLSVVPLRAGKPKANLVIMYQDAANKQFRQKESAILSVADPEDGRPPPTTILNVTGDYLAEGASKVDIRDSVVQRSNIGKDIKVSRGLDEEAMREKLEGMDERSRKRTRELKKGQKDLREDMRKMSKKMKRHMNDISKELPTPYGMRKKTGTLIIEFRCAVCDKGVGTIRDRRWARWVNMGAGAAMAGIGAATLRPEMGIKGIRKLYSDFTGKALDDLPKDDLFLTTEERDRMVKKLRKEGILAAVNYCTECKKWVCEDCYDFDERICNEHLW